MDLQSFKSIGGAVHRHKPYGRRCYLHAQVGWRFGQVFNCSSQPSQTLQLGAYAGTTNSLRWASSRTGACGTSNVSSSSTTTCTRAATTNPPSGGWPAWVVASGSSSSGKAAGTSDRSRHQRTARKRTATERGHECASCRVGTPKARDSPAAAPGRRVRAGACGFSQRKKNLMSSCWIYWFKTLCFQTN